MKKENEMQIKLAVDGKALPLNEFTSTILLNIVMGFVYSLKGGEAKKEIKIDIKM